MTGTGSPLLMNGTLFSCSACRISLTPMNPKEQKTNDRGDRQTPHQGRDLKVLLLTAGVIYIGNGGFAADSQHRTRRGAGRCGSRRHDGHRNEEPHAHVWAPGQNGVLIWAWNSAGSGGPSRAALSIGVRMTTTPRKNGERPRGLLRAARQERPEQEGRQKDDHRGHRTSPNAFDIEAATSQNEKYRTVAWTGNTCRSP